jgi:SAM-dependent methyltransferase
MSFGSIAVDYDRLRPGPPAEAVDWLLPEGCQTAVDLGAGTGLLSRALAGKTARVIAVEPDARMRAVLESRSPGVWALAGQGEAIPLSDASADGVFVSSAWHWMDPDRAIPEIGRVLRDGGRFGLIWTSRDQNEGWLQEMGWQRIGGIIDPDATGERPRHHEVTLPEAGFFRNIETESFCFTRAMTIDRIVAMLATYSRVIIAAPEVRSARLGRVRTVLRERFPDGGEIEVPMRARCWRADRTPRDSAS